MLTFKCSMLTRELFLSFPVRYGMAEGSGILMIRLPFAFYLADPEPDIINVGNLSPGALLLYGRLSYWQQDHSAGDAGSIKSSSPSLSGFLCGISSLNLESILSVLCGTGLEWGWNEAAFVISDSRHFRSLAILPFFFKALGICGCC